MKKQYAALLLAAALPAALLTGCSGTSTKTTTAAPTTEAPTTAAPATTEAAATEAETTEAVTEAETTETATEVETTEAATEEETTEAPETEAETTENETTETDAETSEADETEETTDALATEEESEEESENGGTLLDDIKKAGVLRLGTSPDYAPFEFQDLENDEVVGADIELAKYIADYLGVELEINSMDFEAIQASIMTGQVDLGISGFSYTDERAESMELSDFYNQTENSKQGIIVLKKNADKFKEASDFAGKTVAAQNGALAYTLVSEQLPDAIMQPITNVGDGIMLLKTNQVNGLAVDQANGEMYMNNYDDVSFCDFWFDYDKDGYVVMAKKGETSLISAINEALEQVNTDDLYAGWLEEAMNLAKSQGIDMD